MPHKSRTAPCAAAEGRTRFRTAQAYLEVAKSVLDEGDRDEYLNVAAGLAVFSGVAASRQGHDLALADSAAPRPANSPVRDG
jgi:hypothetical protein